MKKIVMVLMVMVSLAIASCSGDSAKELFETAQLEELQNNYDHATKL